jgi:hypothetical protein
MGARKKDLKREYRQNPRPMGVFQIRNTANGKVLIGVALDLPGIINSQKFQLSTGSHTNKALQADWQQHGPEKFEFEILDELTPGPMPGRDYREELGAMEALWLEKLQPYGESGYNTKKVPTEERLRVAALNRPPRG